MRDRQIKLGSRETVRYGYRIPTVLGPTTATPLVIPVQAESRGVGEPVATGTESARSSESAVGIEGVKTSQSDGVTEKRISGEMKDSSVQDFDDIGLRYVVRVVVTHPSRDLSCLNGWLGLMPTRSWMSGEPFPGIAQSRQRRQTSYWSHRRERTGKRKFSEDVEYFAELLARNGQRLAEIVFDGGSVALLLEFEGVKNIGDLIGISTIAKLVEANCSLGIEVFPDSQH